MEKNFLLKDILTITTGRCIVAGDWGGVKTLIAFLHGDPDGSVYTLTMAHLRPSSAQKLLSQYPELPTLDDISDDDAYGFDWDGWLKEQETRFGRTLPVSMGLPTHHNA